MTRVQTNAKIQWQCTRAIAVIGLLIGAMLFRVWQKVEIAEMHRQYDQAQHELAVLGEERTRLVAGIAFKKKLEMIEHIAVGQMGMVYPNGHVAVAGAWSGRVAD